MENSKSKSKAKTTVKTAKSAAAPKASATKSTKAVKSMPDEEAIRAKAQEIYNERIFRGEHGTPEEDWLKAEGLLKKH